MKNKLVFFVLILLNFCGYSQSLEWIYYSENEKDEIIKDMTVDFEGNVIQLILTQPWETPRFPKSNHIIKKLDQNGTLLWSKSLLVNKIVSIDTDSNGNIFVLGASEGNTDLNPDPDVVNSFYANVSYTGNFNRALFVLKLNSLGEFLTFSTIGEYPGCDGGNGCSIFSYPEQIKVDNNDDILISFKPRSGGFIDIDPSENITYLNPPSSSRIFTIIKWNNNLDGFYWVKYLFGKQEEIISSAGKDITPKAISFGIDSSNNIYVATVYDEDIVLSKYSSEGVLLNNPLENSIEGFGYNNIGSLSLLSDNEIILGGDFINFIDVNPINSNSSEILTSTYPYSVLNNGSTYYNNNDSFLVKYDSSFNVIWKKMISGHFYDYIEDIKTKDGKIYVCGLSQKDYDISDLQYWTEYESYFKIYNAEGELLLDKIYLSPFPRNFGNQGLFRENFLRIQLDNDYPNLSNEIVWKRKLSLHLDSIYISGNYSTIQNSQQGLYFGPFSWYTFKEYGFNFNYYDDNPVFIPLDGYIKPYTTKYNCLECQLSTHEYKNVNISIYPNPASHHLNINCPDGFNYKITSILGEQIKSGSFNNGNKLIKIESLKAGIYLIEIFSNSKKQIFKFLKK